MCHWRHGPDFILELRLASVQPIKELLPGVKVNSYWYISGNFLIFFVELLSIQVSFFLHTINCPYLRTLTRKLAISGRYQVTLAYASATVVIFALFPFVTIIVLVVFGFFFFVFSLKIASKVEEKVKNHTSITTSAMYFEFKMTSKSQHSKLFKFISELSILKKCIHGNPKITL